MKAIQITAPEYIDCDIREWEARYVVEGQYDVRYIKIESRSAIEVIVAKVKEKNTLWEQDSYYISSPNYGVAIPNIPTLLETSWIIDKLMISGLSAPDAVTVAQVLRDLNDF